MRTQSKACKMPASPQFAMSSWTFITITVGPSPAPPRSRSARRSARPTCFHTWAPQSTHGQRPARFAGSVGGDRGGSALRRRRTHRRKRLSCALEVGVRGRFRRGARAGPIRCRSGERAFVASRDGGRGTPWPVPRSCRSTGEASLLSASSKPNFPGARSKP